MKTWKYCEIENDEINIFLTKHTLTLLSRTAHSGSLEFLMMHFVMLILRLCVKHKNTTKRNYLLNDEVFIFSQSRGDRLKNSIKGCIRRRQKKAKILTEIIVFVVGRGEIFEFGNRSSDLFKLDRRIAVMF